MINFNEIYNEEGLSGLISYAHQQGSEGYRFFIDKFMKDGELFFHQLTGFDLPFIDVNASGSFVDTFLDPETSDKFRQAIHQNRDVFTMSISFKQKQDVFDLLQDVGVEIIRINCELELHMTDLANTVTYDGFLSEEYPLRNAEMSLAYHYSFQHLLNENTSPADAFSIFNNLLVKGHILFPMTIVDTDSKVNKKITNDDFEVPFLETNDGSVVLACLSESGFRSFMTSPAISDDLKKLFKNEYVMASQFNDLVYLVKTEKVTINIFDHGMIYAINEDYLDEIMSYDYTIENTEVEIEDNSHIPEFLR